MILYIRFTYLLHRLVYDSAHTHHVGPHPVPKGGEVPTVVDVPSVTLELELFQHLSRQELVVQLLNTNTIERSRTAAFNSVRV